MSWCVYYRDGKAISDIVECNGENSSLIVQMSEDRTILENGLRFFRTNEKRLTQHIISELKLLLIQKEYKKIADVALEYTGTQLCCTGAIENFVNNL